MSSDLALWTPGLTPVLSYASLIVKPHYIELLETYYTPLGKALRPALLSLVMALLPGIDEEGGEYFDRTLALIDVVRSGVEDEPYFWQCFLLATIKSASRRQGALAYLGKRLPKLGQPPQNKQEADGSAATEGGSDGDAVITPEPGLLVRAFCAGLGDDQLLVQRGFLDLLVTHLPLESNVLQHKVAKTDLQLLVLSAASVVLRRDMSLNRRLWAWMLGGLEDSSARTYFKDNGLGALVGGLQKRFRENENPAARARPYRICLSLMDRGEIGSLVVPKLFQPAIESLFIYENTVSDKDSYAEVKKSASMFFDAVEAKLIWAQMLERITVAFDSDNVQELQFVHFILRTFNVQEEEMSTVHGPLVFLAVLQRLADGTVCRGVASTSFLLLNELWSLVPQVLFQKQHAHAVVTSEGGAGAADGVSRSSALDAIKNFYTGIEADQTQGGSLFPAQLPVPKLSAWILDGITVSVQKGLQGETDDADASVRYRLLVQVIQKLPKLDWKGADALVTVFLQVLQLPRPPFTSLQGISNIVMAMTAKGYLTPHHTDSLVRPLVSGMWVYLSPDLPKCHVETVKALWSLQSVLGDRRIESAVATVMKSKSSTSNNPDTEHAKKFAALWRHSMPVHDIAAQHTILARPLFLFLDCLAKNETDTTLFAREWLQTMSGMDRYAGVFFSSSFSFGLLYWKVRPDVKIFTPDALSSTIYGSNRSRSTNHPKRVSITNISLK